MAEAQTWSGVQVFLQSAIGADITISAVSKALEGVVTTSAAHGLANGDYVVATVQGMTQINERVFRVKAASGSSLTLEGEDTREYGSFSSGKLNKVTLGTSIATMVDLSSSGGEAQYKDTTTIHDLEQQEIPSTTTPITYSFANIWDPKDVGLKALMAASRSAKALAMQFVFRSGDIVVFRGTISATGTPTGSAGDLVKTPASIKMRGVPTTYAAA